MAKQIHRQFLQFTHLLKLHTHRSRLKLFHFIVVDFLRFSIWKSWKWDLIVCVYALTEPLYSHEPILYDKWKCKNFMLRHERIHIICLSTAVWIYNFGKSTYIVSICVHAFQIMMKTAASSYSSSSFICCWNSTPNRFVRYFLIFYSLKYAFRYGIDRSTSNESIDANAKQWKRRTAASKGLIK